MGDSFQTFVVQEPLEPPVREALVARVVGPLVERGVLLPARDGRHPAGPASHDIVAPNGIARGWLTVSPGNGVDGRGVFGIGPDGPRCPHCGTELRTRAPVERAAWADAVDRWWRGGDGALTCRACSAGAPIIDWPTGDGPVLGYLAFELWNLAPLREAFVYETRRAIGLRTVFVRGKL